MNRDARHRRDGCAAPRFEGVPSGTTYERAYGDDMCGLGLRCAWYGDQAKSAQHTSVCHSTLGARSGAGPGLGLGSARQTWTTLVWGVLAGELMAGQRVVLLVRRRPHRRVLVAGVRLACRELVRRRCVLPPRGRRRRMPVRVARRARHHRPRVGRVPRRAGGHPVRRRRLPVHWRRRQPAPAVRLSLHLHFVGSTPSSKIQIRLQNLPDPDAVRASRSAQ